MGQVRCIILLFKLQLKFSWYGNACNRTPCSHSDRGRSQWRQAPLVLFRQTLSAHTAMLLSSRYHARSHEESLQCHFPVPGTG